MVLVVQETESVYYLALFRKFADPTARELLLMACFLFSQIRSNYYVLIRFYREYTFSMVFYSIPFVHNKYFWGHLCMSLYKERKDLIHFLALRIQGMGYH